MLSQWNARLVRLSFFALAAGVFACGSSNNTSTDAGTVHGTAQVGAACTQDSDCAVSTCYSGFPGGYCTHYCSYSDECPSGSTCVAYANSETACLKNCKTNADCGRSGYICGLMNTCAPPCKQDSDCPVMGQTCDTTTGICQAHIPVDGGY